MTEAIKARRTTVSSEDTNERYREKLVRITLDSMVQFIGIFDAHGTVLEINKVARDAGPTRTNSSGDGENLSIFYRNGLRLLTLANQPLEFPRMDARNLMDTRYL